jgi:hypothetical protein
LLGLTACGPSEQQRVELAEKKRIECLDKFCEGDVEPKRDMATEVVLKLNGQWYVGPKEYFNGYDGRTGFEWWEHKPISAGMKRPPEMQALAVDGKGYDFSIEIFLGTPKQAVSGKSMYQTLLEMDAKGLTLEKKILRPGLQMWRTREEGRLPETWYVAASLKEPGGDPPTIACRGDDPTYYRCTTGFRWRPDVAASMRFRATHGPDWPEIYLETARILNLLKKA